MSIIYCNKCGKEMVSSACDHKHLSSNAVLAEVRAIAQKAINNGLNDDYMDYQYGKELKEALKSIYNKVSEHFS